MKNKIGNVIAWAFLFLIMWWVVDFNTNELIRDLAIVFAIWLVSKLISATIDERIDKKFEEWNESKNA